MGKSIFDPYLPRFLAEGGLICPIAKGFGLPAEDLFGDREAAMTKLLRGGIEAQDSDVADPFVAFIVAPDVAITVDRESIRPSHIQCLLAAIERVRGHCPPRGTISPKSIDPTCGLTLWSDDRHEIAQIVSTLWAQMSESSVVDQLTAATVPSLYGNKLRLAGFISAAVAASVPAGTPILDIMAGTGVMSRMFSIRHPVWANDANHYAALLSRCQGIDPSEIDSAAVIAAMRKTYAQNQAKLRPLLAGPLEVEALFLHGDLNDDSLERYRAFTDSRVLEVTDGADAWFPARLATERYANVYFGINQCIEIDSLRAAIEATYPSPGPVRDLCLCALILASAICASGPHFAQPPRAHSLRSMRRIIERRARSVSWEFDLALGRLAARAPPHIPFLGSSRLDWRAALRRFAEHNQRPAAVYVDPPYSKLQYSRYYHVLNVLLDYDYPSVEGTGLYPPRSARFSSRFEYQAGTAAREFSDLFRECATLGLTLILSYGDGGFVPIDELARSMGSAYDRVEIFSEELRHHSQGRILSNAKSKVTEYVLVGSFA